MDHRRPCQREHTSARRGRGKLAAAFRVSRICRGLGDFREPGFYHGGAYRSGAFAGRSSRARLQPGHRELCDAELESGQRKFRAGGWCFCAGNYYYRGDQPDFRPLYAFCGSGNGAAASIFDQGHLAHLDRRPHQRAILFSADWRVAEILSQTDSWRNGDIG